MPGCTAAAVVNSQPSPHRGCEIAVRASRWRGTDDASPGLIERKRRRALPGAFGAMLPNTVRCYPFIRVALTMFFMIVL